MTFPDIFILFYLGIFVTTGFANYIFMSNNKERYFNPDAFPSFYQKTSSVFVRIKIHFFMVIFAYLYNFGTFCFALPASIIISDMINVTNYLIELANIVICFFINIFFLILLPSMYELVLNLFDNGVTQAITRWLNEKLGNTKQLHAAGNHSDESQHRSPVPSSKPIQQKISSISINLEEVKNESK